MLCHDYLWGLKPPETMKTKGMELIISCYIMSSHLITSHLIISCHIMLHLITSCYISSHHVTSHHIMLHLIISCYMTLSTYRHSCRVIHIHLLQSVFCLLFSILLHTTPILYLSILDIVLCRTTSHEITDFPRSGLHNHCIDLSA